MDIITDLTGSATTEVIAEVTRIFLKEETVSGIIVVPRSDAPIVSKDAPARIALIKQEYEHKPILIYNLPDVFFIFRGKLSNHCLLLKKLTF